MTSLDSASEYQNEIEISECKQCTTGTGTEDDEEEEDRQRNNNNNNNNINIKSVDPPTPPLKKIKPTNNFLGMSLVAIGLFFWVICASIVSAAEIPALQAYMW